MAKKELKVKKAAAPVRKVSSAKKVKSEKDGAAPVKKITKPKKIKQEQDIVDVIVKAMEEKKAHNIICMDLRNVESAVTDFFVICHGTSTTQVEAIGNSVEDEVQKTLGERPFHAEGYRNGEWVLIDYFNVVAHIFIEEKRDFYRLEKLWADAEIRKVG